MKLVNLVFKIDMRIWWLKRKMRIITGIRNQSTHRSKQAKSTYRPDPLYRRKSRTCRVDAIGSKQYQGSWLFNCIATHEILQQKLHKAVEIARDKLLNNDVEEQEDWCHTWRICHRFVILSILIRLSLLILSCYS